MGHYAILAIVVLLSVLISGCAQPAVPQQNNSTVPPANNSTPPPSNGTNGVPNPASEFCVKNGGSLEIRSDSDGQYGVCAFQGGAKCEEWAFFRGECSADAPNFCDDASGCACGVHKETRGCFYGQAGFVDTTRQCPDFCSGIAGHLEIVCESHKCAQVQREPVAPVQDCSGFELDSCPDGCVVCPPCPECSSLRCSNESFCESMGYGKEWYNGTRPPK